jgi:hypothetical protein
MIMRIEINGLMATLVAVAGLALSPTAQAGLGEGVDSVARDHASLRAHASSVVPMQAYDLHEMTTADGGRVREYVTRDGTVFAVTFSGRTMPDLHTVLGSRYAEYAAATSARRTNHKVFAMSAPGLVMEVVKLPRGITGSAHVPSLLPSGVTARDLR